MGVRVVDFSARGIFTGWLSVKQTAGRKHNHNARGNPGDDDCSCRGNCAGGHRHTGGDARASHDQCAGFGGGDHPH